MKKFLISLAKDIKRRELFFSQPNTQNFEVFEAINTMSESDENLKTLFDADRFYSRYHREMTKGEVGCTLSHLQIYRNIVQDDELKQEEYVLICEDDALLAENFQTDLEILLQQNIAADIILLGQSKISSFNDRELSINYPTTFSFLQKKVIGTKYRYSYPYKNYFAGTVAYLIKKSAANTFLLQLAKNGKPFWLADDFLLFENEFKIDSVVIRPLMVIENPHLISNLEGIRGSVKQSVLMKMVKYPAKKLMALVRNI